MAHHPRYQLISQDCGVGMKTSELTGDALDWAVAKIEYTKPVTIGSSTLMVFKDVPFDYHPSTNWAQGGAIIEREGISTWVFDDVTWKAENPFASGVDQVFEGSTPLIAAMRCYVASVMGDEVDVPEELQEVVYE